MEIRFTLNSKGKPPCYAPILSEVKRKLADCEIYFEAGTPLEGLKLQGFVIWERLKAEGNFPVGHLSVTPPGYQKPTNFRDTVSLLRRADDDNYSYVSFNRGPLYDQIIAAWREFVREVA